MQSNNESYEFKFDHLFPPSASQEAVFEVAGAPIVDSVMQGFNGSTIAYGQTSSGKTFTMLGPRLDDEENMGVIPRIVRELFRQMLCSSPDLEFIIKISFVELYMERFKDLFYPIKDNLKIKEDKTRGIYIEELTEEYASSEQEVFDLMRMGSENREVVATQMNQDSSRSHAIFMISVTQNNLKDYSSKTGKLYLVDLAGSEKLSKTGAEGKRLDEAKKINKSLTILGRVISALTDEHATHIPYRDSKLTRVLQESLGGNSKTSLIITCSPSPYNSHETLSTLRFGIRAKKVKNKPKVNREYSVAELKLKLAKAYERIAELEIQLKAAGASSSPNKSARSSMMSQVHPSDALEELEHELELYKNLLDDAKSDYGAQVVKIEELMNEVQSLTHENVELNQLLNAVADKLQEAENKMHDMQDENQKLTTISTKLEEQIHTITEQKKIFDDSFSTETDEFEIVNIPIEARRSFGDELSGLKAEIEIRSERENNIEKQIESLKKQLDDALNNKVDIRSLKETIINEAALTEREKWAEEKFSIMKDLHNRIHRVVKLEMELDLEKEKNKKLESALANDSKSTKRKILILEKNNSELVQANIKLTSQRDSATTDLQVAEKRIARLTEQMVTLDQQNKHLKDQLSRSEDKRSKLQTEVIDLSRQSRYSLAISRVIKPIRGGRVPIDKLDRSRIQSTINFGESYKEEIGII
jgi:kinesin family protein 5